MVSILGGKPAINEISEGHLLIGQNIGENMILSLKTTTLCLFG